MSETSTGIGRSPTVSDDRFQILALDGGGAKALFTAHILARLEEDLGVSVADSFDLVAGTSAGGIVALALGSGMRPAEIVDHFSELVSSVFPSRRRGDQPRDAAAVSASFSGQVVTGTSTDLGSIVIGWGDTHGAAEITTPRPEDVTARCTGRGDELAVEITAPHGWTIRAAHGSPLLTVGNTDQDLPAAELDTTNPLLAALDAVAWSQIDQLDIAATVDGPAEWNAAHSGRVYVSVHVDCR